jgi:hypothetical protein
MNFIWYLLNLKLCSEEKALIFDTENMINKREIRKYTLYFIKLTSVTKEIILIMAV